MALENINEQLCHSGAAASAPGRTPHARGEHRLAEQHPPGFAVQFWAPLKVVSSSPLEVGAGLCTPRGAATRFSTSPGTDSALGEFLCHQLSWICSAGSFLIIGKGAALPKLFLYDAERQGCLSQAWSLCVSRRKPQEQRAPAQPVSLQQLRGTAS